MPKWIKDITYIGFSIQIVLGIIWMCCNFAHLQYYEVPGGGVLTSWLTSLAGIYPVLYLVQLGCAFGVAYLLWTFVDIPLAERIWRSLVLVTFPMALQCHMAVSPYSFLSSFFVLELLFTVGLMREECSNVTLYTAGSGICWIVTFLLMPEYAYLGGIPFVILLLTLAAGRKKYTYGRRGIRVLGGFAVSGILVAVLMIALKEVNVLSLDNVLFALYHRVCWPFMIDDSIYWPEAAQIAMQTKLVPVASQPSKMYEIFRPTMKGIFSDAEWKAFMWDGIRFAWANRKMRILKLILWDGFGYTFAPVALPFQLGSVLMKTNSGRNYEILLNHTPVLTGCWFRFGWWWFDVAGILGIVSLGFQRKICKLREGILWGLTLLGVVVFYTLREAGMCDYKRVTAVTIMWIVVILLVARKETKA